MKKLVALLLTFLFILTGCDSVEIIKVEDDVQTDAIRFSKEYELDDKNNIYNYATYDTVIDTIESGTGIVYLGFPTCVLCKDVIPVLNDVAKSKDVNEILYYDFKDIRENNTDEYLELVNLLYYYINGDEEGNKKLTAPTVIFVNSGNIVGVYVGTSSSDGEEILTEDEKETLKKLFSSLIDKVLVEEETTKEELTE